MISTPLYWDELLPVLLRFNTLLAYNGCRDIQ